MADDESEVDELTDGLVSEVAEAFEAGSVERKNSRVNRYRLQQFCSTFQDSYHDFMWKFSLCNFYGWKHDF